MLFNSFEFALFFFCIFSLYWFAARFNLKLQNGLLLIAGYLFYACWDWRFLGLIFVSSLVDFQVGKALSRSRDPGRKKAILAVSIITDLGILGFFKYFNFFAESFQTLLTALGLVVTPLTLKILLPVGISFYTFKSLSYTIDVYRGKLAPTDDAVAYFTFVSFFPQLAAGPIERAGNLLPQLCRPRVFTYDQASDGLRQICWGLFKKLVVADNCAVVANIVFDNYQTLDGSALLLGAFFFAFQIYGDFSGYSDMAVGTAKLLGFTSMPNFATPYFSRNIGEFWRRWHISLSTWFRDYVYIPLGGNQGGKPRRFFNIIVTFTLSGLWHGANWTFLFWGLLNGLYYLPLIVFGERHKYKEVIALGRLFPSVKETVQVGTTFFFTTAAWIFFRTERLTDALAYLGRLFSASLLRNPAATLGGYGIKFKILYAFIAILTMMTIEWFQRDKEHGLAINHTPLPLRYCVYAGVVLMILLFRHIGQDLDFIYFKF